MDSSLNSLATTALNKTTTSVSTTQKQSTSGGYLTGTTQNSNWPGLSLPPINLWNVPKMNNCFAVTVTFFIRKDEVECTVFMILESFKK